MITMASDLLAKASSFVFNENDELLTKIVIASIMLLIIFWWRHVFYNSNEKGVTPLPRGPRGLPVVGYLPFLRGSLPHTLADLARSYGPIFELRLGRKLCVVMTSPTLAKQVLRDHDATFANRDMTAAGMVFSFGQSDCAFAPNGPQWRKVRKVLVREMMNNASLNASYALRRKEIRNAIRDVYSKVGEAMDLGEIAFFTVLNTTLSSIWGGTISGDEGNSVKTEFKHVVEELVKIVGRPNISDYFPAIARFDLQGVEKETKRLVKWLETIIDPVIEGRMKMMEKRGAGEGSLNTGTDFMQILLELKDRKSDGAALDVRDVKGLMMNILNGATDTSGTMTEWAMAELLKHPNVMKKVQEELTSVVGVDNIVEESHIPELHYLDAVVKETLRLHPAAPILIPRSPSATCTVGGYTIPKGATIFLNVWAMHRDPEAWEDPLEFKPERFLNSEGSLDYSGNDFHYLPFGSGRRICAGLPLAERMLMYFLASLLHSFEWKLPEGEELDMAETFSLVLKMSNPLKAIPTPRLANPELYA